MPLAAVTEAIASGSLPRPRATKNPSAVIPARRPRGDEDEPEDMAYYADLAKHEGQRRKLNPAQQLRVNEFAELDLHAKLIMLYASAVVTDKAVTKLVVAKVQFTGVSNNLRGNLKHYAGIVLLCVKLPYFKLNNAARNALIAIVKTLRWDLPDKIEFDRSAWNVVVACIDWCVTQSRHSLKREVGNSVAPMLLAKNVKKGKKKPSRKKGKKVSQADAPGGADEEEEEDDDDDDDDDLPPPEERPGKGWYDLSKARVCVDLYTLAGDMCKKRGVALSAEHLARVAIMRHVLVNVHYASLHYWDAVDLELRWVRETAKGDADAMNRALRAYITTDIAVYGGPDDSPFEDIEPTDYEVLVLEHMNGELRREAAAAAAAQNNDEGEDAGVGGEEVGGGAAPGGGAPAGGAPAGGAAGGGA